MGLDRLNHREHPLGHREGPDLDNVVDHNRHTHSPREALT
jgi:hypothetical protein